MLLFSTLDTVKDIHIENIEAGSNVIITNNYYVTPNILKRENLEADFEKLVQCSIDIAEEARSGFKNILIAGSFLRLRPALDPI